MIILTYQDLPSHVSALVHENSDDSYTIIVNRNISDDGKKKAIRHEVNHIIGGDLFKEQNVNSIETACHNNAEMIHLGEDLDIYVKS